MNPCSIDADLEQLKKKRKRESLGDLELEEEDDDFNDGEDYEWGPEYEDE